MAPAATQDTRLLNTDTTCSNTSSSMIIGGSRCALGEEGRRQLAVSSSVEPRARCSPSSGPVVALRLRSNIRLSWIVPSVTGIRRTMTATPSQTERRVRGRVEPGTGVPDCCPNKQQTDQMFSVDSLASLLLNRQEKRTWDANPLRNDAKCFHPALMLAGVLLFFLNYN